MLASSLGSATGDHPVCLYLYIYPDAPMRKWARNHRYGYTTAPLEREERFACMLICVLLLLRHFVPGPMGIWGTGSNFALRLRDNNSNYRQHPFYKLSRPGILVVQLRKFRVNVVWILLHALSSWRCERLALPLFSEESIIEQACALGA